MNTCILRRWQKHPAQANADFIVLACNAYYSDQATIAAQAARIAWLERRVTQSEIDAVCMLWQPDVDDGATLEKMAANMLVAALAIRTKPENGEL